MSKDSSPISRSRRPRPYRHRSAEAAWACRVLADQVQSDIDLLRTMWHKEGAPLFGSWPAAYAWLRAKERQWLDGAEGVDGRNVRVRASRGPGRETWLVPAAAAVVIDHICEVTGWGQEDVVWRALTGGLPQMTWRPLSNVQDIVRRGYLDVRIWLWSLGPATLREIDQRLRATILPVVMKLRGGWLIGPSNTAGPYGAWGIRPRQGRLLMVMADCGGPPVDRRKETQRAYWQRLTAAYGQRFRDEQMTANGLRWRYRRLRPKELAEFRALQRESAMLATWVKYALHL